ncbi:riboflavin biosynthesis protein RibF [bacterium F11]|nr:riboflavin biosynthesis protein RibF [bacterium F11]
MRRGRLLTIGSFDGVHLGHSALLERTVLEAKKRQLKPTALTFRLPPRMVLHPERKISFLTNEQEKEILIRQKGINEVITLEFNRNYSHIRPFLFFRDVLIRTYKAKGLVVGLDFRFGLNRSAGASELVRWGLEYEIPVWVISPVTLKRKIVSSTLIREKMDQNRLKEASQYLGHPYLIQGKVVKGRSLGKKLGFPTANLQCSESKILPLGVYAVMGRIQRSKKILKGVCNIGVRPSFLAKSPVTMEVHWFGKTLNLTGKGLLVELHHRIRSEKKFSGQGGLQRQIRKDIEIAKAFLKKRPVMSI